MKELPSSFPFVSLDELRRLLRHQHARLIDARAQGAYSQAHLPGAVNLPARDLNQAANGVRELVAPGRLAEMLKRPGVGADTTVIYGAKGGSDAAHVWWTLHGFGHPAVYLLDGGMEAWQRAGLPLSSDQPEPKPPEMPFAPSFDMPRLATLRELIERIDDPTLTILDTRAREEYTGELAAAKHGGHIPNAKLFDWAEALDRNGMLKPDHDLKRALAPVLGAPEIITYCQSGVRAAHTYAVLTKLGHPRVRLYLGSWGEWGNRDDTPIETIDPQEVTP
ncbi:MAG TPA: sulfurtransferase [Trueperaceae bacterium]